jgi:DNA primase
MNVINFFRFEHGGGGNFEYIETFEDSSTKKSTPSDNFVIPAEWVSIEDKPRQYIDERMISRAPNVTSRWTMYYNQKTRRLVIPWFKNGKIIYYQERALYRDQQPKYLFPKNITERPLFGVDNIDTAYPWIFYLEGALDSIWVKNGVAAGSISLSKTQMDTLSNFVEQRIVYFPDNPWVDKASLENIRKLSQTQKDLLVWMWPKEIKEKDVNEVVCRFEAPELFFNDRLHENVVSVQKARCMLELMS